MLFSQFTKNQSLRDISKGLRSATGNLNHLGNVQVPSKSNLGYQNKHRNWELFRLYKNTLLRFIVADRFYNDFSLLNIWDSNELYFVIRHRDNLKFTSIKENEQVIALITNQMKWSANIHRDKPKRCDDTNMDSFDNYFDIKISESYCKVQLASIEFSSLYQNQYICENRIAKMD